MHFFGFFPVPVSLIQPGIFRLKSSVFAGFPGSTGNFAAGPVEKLSYF